MSNEEAIAILSNGILNGKDDTPENNEAVWVAIKALTAESERSKVPPLGVMPRWLHDDKRLEDLTEAIKRYAEADFRIPDAWLEEYEELMRRKFERESGK